MFQIDIRQSSCFEIPAGHFIISARLRYYRLIFIVKILAGMHEVMFLSLQFSSASRK